MTRPLIVLLAAAAFVAAVALALPPRPRALAAPEPAIAGARGVIHIHTRRSDGSGLPDAIAAAAARAGLQFIVLTDHDDVSTEPTRPYYRNGVLIIEGAEISAEDGHVVALDLPRAPYPLGGESRDVIDDIHRLGGFAIAAHPGSAKEDLRWRNWEEPFDGVEWLNGDSEWRDEPMTSLIGALFTYPFRRAETVARLFDRPEPVLARWDELTQQRRVVAVAAADAHARIGLRSGEPDDPLLAVHLPSYEAVLRASSITAGVASLSGDPAADARAILDAIRSGNVYSSVDAVAAPAAMSFTAAAGGRRYDAGAIVPADGTPVELQVVSNAPSDARIVLLRNGKEIVSEPGPQLQYSAEAEPAAWRAEIHLPDAPGAPAVPWVVSNPIYIGVTAKTPRETRPPAEVSIQYQNGPAEGWTVATSVRSRAALDVIPGPGGTQVAMRYGLGGTLSESPYAALVMPAGNIAGYDRVMFVARATRPMRLSVQLRAPTGGDGERWHRSVYVDEEPREITVFFDDMRPRGDTRQPRPDLASVHAVMFVVDTVNTKPGTSGQVAVGEVRYAR